MASGSVSARRRSGSLGDLVLGSWPRTVTAAGLIALLVVLGLWAFASGWLGGLRYASFPGHPYPPPGYYQNPFNPKDRGDLVNADQASRVKADLLSDGSVELQAVATGDATMLARSTTARALTQLQALIAQNNGKDIVEKEDVHLSSVIVGDLVDPNDSSIAWCVEEKGTGTIITVSKSTGKQLSVQSLRFDNRFWLVPANGRYLIADVLVTAAPSPAG